MAETIAMPRLLADYRATDGHGPTTVVLPTFGRSERTVVETPEDGVAFTVTTARLSNYRAEATTVVEPPASAHIDDHPLTVGARVYVVGVDPRQEVDEGDTLTCVLLSVEGGRKGVALIAWWQPNHYAGPSMRAQAYRADVLTHDPRLAVASWQTLRDNGWPR